MKNKQMTFEEAIAAFKQGETIVSSAGTWYCPLDKIDANPLFYLSEIEGDWHILEDEPID